jgi:2-amino-4-hydroxy-6-hydroxymethyldihydropteridine diphosphokinase
VNLAYVGIGSNLDKPVRQVENAFLELSRVPQCRVVKRSSLYRSAPLGYRRQPEFVNAVAAVQTMLEPHELLDGLQAIEADHGRERSFPNAPRTLDLDLLLFGDSVMNTGRLTVPHPRMQERAFVLEPLVEIAPEAEIPGIGPARHWLEKCAGQRVEKIG